MLVHPQCWFLMYVFYMHRFLSHRKVLSVVWPVICPSRVSKTNFLHCMIRV